VKRLGRKVAAEDEQAFEKWLVAFRNPASKRHPDGSVLVRQFYAPGYYEAYDTVMTHAEKMSLEVLWFREKRSCEPFLNRNFPDLESICTFCNKRYNHSEPIPCAVEECAGQFCSRECLGGHTEMKH
jgi:hypothetical protein